MGHAPQSLAKAASERIRSGLSPKIINAMHREEELRKCCNFENGDGGRFGIEVSCGHLEQPIDELNLSPNVRAAHPPRLPLPNHVHGLVSLDGPPRRVKLSKPLLRGYRFPQRSGDVRSLQSVLG